FATGMKWAFIPKQSESPKYILINGDESEPATCKDRLICEYDPHSVIEGVIIAGLAVGAKTGFIYLRGEYRYLLEIMEKAVADAYAKGFLGKNIFGSGREFNILTHTGAGAYEVGEESALMESLEGKRGLPLRYPIKKMIYDVGGGIPNGRNLKALVPGGSSTFLLTREEAESATMDYDWFAKRGEFMGSGGVVAIDDQTCMVKMALRIMKFYQHESCGWCIPCREGTDWLKKTLTRFHDGGGVNKDIDQMLYLANNMAGRT